MDLSIHLITLLPLIIALYPFFGINSLLAIIGGFLIDFDHYLWSIHRWKSLSLKKAYHYHKNICTIYKERDVLHIFHTTEFFIFLTIITIIAFKTNQEVLYTFLLITLISLTYHQIFDFIDMGIKNKWGERAISLIFWLKRNKIKSS